MGKMNLSAMVKGQEIAATRTANVNTALREEIRKGDVRTYHSLDCDLKISKL